MRQNILKNIIILTLNAIFRNMSFKSWLTKMGYLKEHPSVTRVYRKIFKETGLTTPEIQSLVKEKKDSVKEPISDNMALFLITEDLHLSLDIEFYTDEELTLQEQYEKETGKKALYSNILTEDYEEWRFKKKIREKTVLKKEIHDNGEKTVNILNYIDWENATGHEYSYFFKELLSVLDYRISEIDFHDLLLLLERFPREADCNDIEVYEPDEEKCEAFKMLFFASLVSGLEMEKFPVFIEVMKKFEYGNCRFSLFKDMIERIKNRVVMERYSSLVEATFLELIQELEKVDYDYRFSGFKFMMEGINNTPLMEKYSSLIETTFKKLLRSFYLYPEPEYPNYDDFDEWASLREDLVAAIENAEILQKKVPYFSRLFDVAMKNLKGLESMDMEEDKYKYFMEFFALIEGILPESHDGGLLRFLGKLLENFTEIQKDKDLLMTFSIFYETLERKNPTLAREEMIKSILPSATNLSVIKKLFPKMCSISENDLISDIIKNNNSSELVLTPPPYPVLHNSSDLFGGLTFVLCDEKGTIGALDNFLDFDWIFLIDNGHKSKSPDSYWLSDFVYAFHFFPFDDNNTKNHIEYAQFYLSYLLDLIDNKSLEIKEISDLLLLFDIIVRVFYLIHKNEKCMNAVSILVEQLSKNNFEALKQIIEKKIQLYATNLSDIKKRFPETWEEIKNTLEMEAQEIQDQTDVSELKEKEYETAEKITILRENLKEVKHGDKWEFISQKTIHHLDSKYMKSIWDRRIISLKLDENKYCLIQRNLQPESDIFSFECGEILFIDDVIGKLELHINNHEELRKFRNWGEPFVVFEKVEDVLFLKNLYADKELLWKTDRPEISLKKLPLLVESHLVDDLLEKSQDFWENPSDSLREEIWDLIDQFPTPEEVAEMYIQYKKKKD